FTYIEAGDKSKLNEIEGSGLGLLRSPEMRVLRRGKELVSLTPEVREFLKQPSPLIITKSNVKTHVHRRAYMDYIGVKQYDANGRLKGELRIVGLFTSAAYTRAARSIPFLRRKIDLVLKITKFALSTHSGRALVNVLESYPRDELFQIDIDTLVEVSLGILQLAQRPRTRIFVRHDKFDRFVSVLAFVPRDYYDTSVRIKIGALLATAFSGHLSAFYPAFPEGPMARVHFIIGRSGGGLPKIDLAGLEAQVAAAARDWSSNLRTMLERTRQPVTAQRLQARYGTGFSPAYQDSFSPDAAAIDIDKMETITDTRPLALNLRREAGGLAKFTLYHLGKPIALSDRLPILENMGFRAINERSFENERGEAGDTECIWMHEIALQADQESGLENNVFKALIEDAFAAVWTGDAQDDTYNQLIQVIAAAWREVSVLRAVGKYLQQAGITFSQGYMARTLRGNGALARLLMDLFRCRFDPATKKTVAQRTKQAQALLAQIETGLEAVSVLDEDRIIRRFANVLMAMLRTNFYRRDDDGALLPAIAFKLNSALVDGLPKPRPYAEIFVYSPRVEGVHLRGGRIARGGLRWSDRPQDFRTEVLGLAKAQQVKNAVIVPVGSKGGFVPKRMARATTREEILAEGIACYKIFVSSLLSLTDNIVGAKTLPPGDVVCHDDVDPYLVVAADKGTATFSDIANEISTSSGFWLGDAFASGGSAGYDHKKMGITARGGWEAVKRHFREMDRDIQTEPFTVVGCGDMSGDVFGNGMLLSKMTKLIAAFDHRDIFIDPNPDPAKSWAERQRLFRLTRSSWKDYKTALISKGGGVFSRSLKSIKLSAQIKQVLGVAQDTMTPNELIRAVLCAQADLLWFGGIGTYVRATSETDEDAGDRASDALRITAQDLAVKVVGEGANLGLTQRARIEYAQGGGRINTDAIDNSAGVNSSDMEVNIKIALGAAVAAGRLTLAKRNVLLASMTDEVGTLVLRNNYEQTLCLSLIQARGAGELGFQIRLMKELEARDLLDRGIEFLPDEVELAERQERGAGLVRPELAVILAWSKIALFDDLIDSDVPDDKYLSSVLEQYFPSKMRAGYVGEIGSHRLRRHIIATMLANTIVNHGGATVITRLRDETGANVAEIAAAFTLARDAFELDTLSAQIDDLDTKVPGDVQISLYLDLQDLTLDQAAWFLRHGDLKAGLKPVVEHYRDGIAKVAKMVARAAGSGRAATAQARQEALIVAGVPKALAQRIAQMAMMARATDIILVADATKHPVDTIAKAYFTLGETLHIDRLVDEAQGVPVAGYYDRLALNRTIGAITSAQRQLTANAFSGKAKGLDAWMKARGPNVKRAGGAVDELIASGTMTLSKLSVASGYLSDLTGE
ncbi:MAG: NAD-glutamate dehydrogenase, partial [Alphaproteobacteria bacterium]